MDEQLTCPACNGKGYTLSDPHGDGWWKVQSRIKCFTCNGKGKVPEALLRLGITKKEAADE